MGRLPLDGEVWCRKCPEPATHTRMVRLGGGDPVRAPYCDEHAWLIGNQPKGGKR